MHWVTTYLSGHSLLVKYQHSSSRRVAIVLTGKNQMVSPWCPGKMENQWCGISRVLTSSPILTWKEKPGSAAQNRESAKRSLYANLEANFHFIPVCVETLWPFGEEGLKLFRRIGDLMKNLTGEKRSTSFLIQSISDAVQRGNAASILGTVPSDTSLEEIYYLWYNKLTKDPLGNCFFPFC